MKTGVAHHGNQDDGAYRPLSSWQSTLTTDRPRCGALAEPRIQRIFGFRLSPGAVELRIGDNRDFEPPYFTPAFLASSIFAAWLVIGSTVFTLLAL